MFTPPRVFILRIGVLRQIVFFCRLHVRAQVVRKRLGQKLAGDVCASYFQRSANDMFSETEYARARQGGGGEVVLPSC